LKLFEFGKTYHKLLSDLKNVHLDTFFFNAKESGRRQLGGGANSAQTKFARLAPAAARARSTER
jgi:hypothetical protein